MSARVIEHDGTKYAQIIRADLQVDKTTFFSAPDSSFQFGLLAHEAGFVEPPHYHKPFRREIHDLQQMFVMQRGAVVIELYSDAGELLEEVLLRAGDAVVLIHGIHSIRVLEHFQAISVKQGPFYGTEYDKVNAAVRKS